MKLEDLETLKINCSNSTTIFDTRDYIDFNKAKEIIQSQQQKIDELTKDVEEAKTRIAFDKISIDGKDEYIKELENKLNKADRYGVKMAIAEEENQQLKQELKQEEKEKKTLLRAHNKDRLKIKKLKQELEQLREENKNAFLQGFKISGEGWNGEYPYEGYSDTEILQDLNQHYELYLELLKTKQDNKD